SAHRALSVVDLMICATASYHRLTVVHDDNDFATAAQHAVDLDIVHVGEGPNET
ncbi:MAG: PIN domain-containing protein, partial [Pseudonocardiaceae bacterium]